MHLILLDSEVVYVKELLKQICQSWPEMCLFGVWRTDLLISLLPRLAGQQVLVLYNQIEHPDLTGWIQKQDHAYPLEDWVFLPLYPDGQAIADRPDHIQHRLESTERLFEYIKGWIFSADNQCRSLDTSETIDHSDPETVPGTGHSTMFRQDSPQIWFVLRLKPTHSEQLIKRQLKSALSSGLKTIYLPLMPTYLMQLMNPPDQGPTLSDLLLLLMGNAIDDSEAGHYLQPTRQGWLQFRAPVRSDDLVSCDQSVLRKLLQFIRHSISQNPAFVLIDCQGIALSSAMAAAAAADVCQVLLPDSAGYARQAADRELSRLLNQLPNSCQVIIEKQQSRPAPIDDLAGKSEV